MQSGETSMELKALSRLGWSVTALAREYGLSRTTVYKELASSGPRSYGRAKPTELNDGQRIRIARTTPAPVKVPHIRFETGPRLQTQVDWAKLGLFPLGEQMVELSAMVAILGLSRAPAIRFATDQTRARAFERLVRCLGDLGGVTREILTDRDVAFCIGSTSEGQAILAPEWVDLASLLGVVPKACRPYRAKTKGKVERMIRELKESFLPWLSRQLLPPQPAIADYDALARRWIQEVVLERRHRTTRRIVGYAWADERPLLRAIPERVLTKYTANLTVLPLPAVNNEQRQLGDVVQIRLLSDYEEATQ